MEPVFVQLGHRSYPIFIGSGLINIPDLIVTHIRSNKVLIVTNETIAPLYLDTIRCLFSRYQCDSLILKDGECYKSLEVISQIFDTLLGAGHGRNTTLVALGGGVIGDMTGFAAACYQRGVPFVQIPTTLLAQVDSSVGGKTGVNHPLGKNMIGAFHQPACVLIDVDTLDTLPEREYRSGIAEVIKYGLICDSIFFDWLSDNADKILSREKDSLIYAIHRSCSIKASIVAEDEMESGIRALLNFGHTFGHAIESWQEYSGYLHGEAVAIGSVIACRLSCRLGILPEIECLKAREIFLKFGLPVSPPDEMSSEAFISFMQRDKKNIDGIIRLILLESIGKAVIYEEAAIGEIIHAIDDCRRLSNEVS